MSWNITQLKQYSSDEKVSIQQKSVTQSELMDESIQILAMKWTTNQDIADLIYHLNTLSEGKWYGQLSIISVTEDVQSTVISLIWVSEEQLIEIMDIKK